MIGIKNKHKEYLNIIKYTLGKRKKLISDN